MFGQPIVPLIAIDLKNAVKTAQEDFGILSRAIWGVEIDSPGGSSPPHGLSSRACAHNYPVFVRIHELTP